MLTKKNLGAIVFFARDLDKSEAFYRDVLELNTRRMEGDDGVMLMVDLDNLVLIFFKGWEKPGRTPIPVFDITGDDINALVDALTERGVEIIAPVQHAPDGGLTADFLDPDGHVLSFYHSPETASGA